MSEENYRADSYRYATAPALSDDNRTADGFAKSRRIPWFRAKKEIEADDLKQELDFDHHKIPADDLLDRFGSHAQVGLTHAKAHENLERDGPNALAISERVPEWIKFLKHLFGGFALLLWAGVILCFVTYSVEDSTTDDPSPDSLYMGIVLTLVIITTGVFTYFQERKSALILESFESLIPRFATVIRQGEKINIPAEQIVLGDIVEINAGDRIPADIRLIEVRGLKVDNSSLTGESEPQIRSVDMTHDNPLETKNLAFFSTHAVEGSGRGVVIGCGHHTIMGRIADLAEDISSDQSPIARELLNFVHITSTFGIFMGIIFFIIALSLGYHWLDCFIFLIGITVANVPEGLLLVVTVCLTLSAKRLASKNCLVKNLEAVETLGSTTTICVDKTGTLTQNKMSVSHLWYDNNIFEANPSVNDDFLFDVKSSGFRSLAKVAALAGSAEFAPNQDDIPIYKRKVMGDSTEAALLKFTENTWGNVSSYRRQNKKIIDYPFDPVRKFQLSIHETQDREFPYILVMKGAPEIVIGHCSSILINGNEKNIDERVRVDFHNAYINLGSLGERVLGFCDLKLPRNKFPLGTKFDLEKPNFPLTGLRFVGLISLVDPPRFGVPDAILKCRSAGIKVIMMTGDHPTTAKAIAKSVGIISEGAETAEDIARRRNIPLSEVDPRDAHAAVIHGNDLRDFTSKDLDEILTHHTEIVFARITPQQKLSIVESCQRSGEIVAVTGDGVNDSPALKKADIGIAMGLTGSDISKEAADIVILDDNFATVVSGIEEGRVVFDNLKKSVAYILTSNMPEIFPFLTFLVLDIPLPLGTLAILCIDLGTDILPAISLTYERAESDVMQRLPRDSATEPLISNKLLGASYGRIGMIQVAAGFYAYFVVMATNGFSPLYLIGLRKQWDSRAVNDLQDSYGQEWTYYHRKSLEYTCHTAFLVAIVLVQWANVIICKTRRNSVFSQGMSNQVLNFSLIFETFLVILLSYIPGMGTALHTMPLNLTWWLPGLPFMLVTLVFDEVRKGLIRRNPGRWLDRETSY